MRNIWTIFGRQTTLDDFWTPNKIFGRQTTLDNFWTPFLVSIGLRIGQDLKNVQILHL